MEIFVDSTKHFSGCGLVHQFVAQTYVKSFISGSTSLYPMGHFKDRSFVIVYFLGQKDR